MLEIKTFPQDMSSFAVDHQDPRRCLVSGVFEETVDVQGTPRTFYTYLTPGLRYNQPCLVVAAPEGVSGPEYLEKSAWMTFADEHKLFLFLAVPEKDHWKLDGSDADYFNKVYLQIKDWLCAGDELGEIKVAEPIGKFLTNLIQLYKLESDPSTYQVGEITYFVFRNAKGTPMLTVGRVADMPHANYPRESWIAYDEFMSKFSRAEDGTLLYMGKPAL